MMPVVYINCSRHPFLKWIACGMKVYETRSRNTLRALVGKKVYLAMTGKGPSLVVCTAVIRKVFPVCSRYEWDCFRDYTAVPEGSEYDWTESTTIKYLYELSSVKPVTVPFHPDNGVRHGRVWMEIDR